MKITIRFKNGDFLTVPCKSFYFNDAGELSVTPPIPSTLGEDFVNVARVEIEEPSRPALPFRDNDAIVLTASRQKEVLIALCKAGRKISAVLIIHHLFPNLTLLQCKEGLDELFLLEGYQS